MGELVFDGCWISVYTVVTTTTVTVGEIKAQELEGIISSVLTAWPLCKHPWEPIKTESFHYLFIYLEYDVASLKPPSIKYSVNLPSKVSSP